MDSCVAHFSSLDKKLLDIYLYSNKASSVFKKKNIDETVEIAKDSSQVALFIPSSMINSYEYHSDFQDDDFVISQFINEYEDKLIQDISSMKIKYYENVIYLFDKNLLDEINYAFSSLNAEIYIYPEHLLGKFINNEAIFKINDRINFLFENQTGSSLINSQIDEFVKIINNEYPNFNPVVDEKLKDITSNRKSEFYKFDLKKIHRKLLNNVELDCINFFSRFYSIPIVLSRLSLTLNQLTILLFLFLIIFIYPYAQDSYIDKKIQVYKKETTSLFQILNPSFKRLIDPRSQIDNMLKDFNFKKIEKKNNSIDMSFLDTLPLDDINSVTYNLKANDIALNIDSMPIIKYKILQELAIRKDLIEVSEEVTNEDGFISGKISYKLYEN